MTIILNNPLVLDINDTESNAFRLRSGDHVLAAGLPPYQGEGSAPAFPSNIKLQYRIRKNNAQVTIWRDAGVTLTATDSIDYFKASPTIEYRVKATSAGCLVYLEPAVLAVFN